MYVKSRQVRMPLPQMGYGFRRFKNLFCLKLCRMQKVVSYCSRLRVRKQSHTMKPIANLFLTDTTLRVLILEDDPDHAFVIQHRLQRDRGNCTFFIADDEQAFRNALSAFTPQLVLTDNSLPAFDALEALRVVRKEQPSAICFMITGLLDEERAIDFIREGGDDCIDKVELSRLYGAVKAAFARRSRMAPHKAERQRAKKMELLQSYLDSSPDGMLALDSQGYIMHINEMAGLLLSGKAWAPTGNLVWEVFPATKGSFFDAAFHAVLKDKQPLTIRMYLELTGSWIDCVFKPLNNGMTVLIRSVNTEEDLREKYLEMQQRAQEDLDLAASLAAQQERRLLGQELHDNVNQLLASAKLFLTLMRDSPERLAELLPYCENSVSKAIEENRLLAHGLTTTYPEREGLPARLEQLCDTMLRPDGIACEIHAVNFKDGALSPSTHLTLYRILQEHCHNIARHAGATRVLLDLHLEDDVIRVCIADNGRGANLNDAAKGIGLTNMKRRARELGGHIDVSTSPGNGFVLRVKLPL
ncbi:MAG: hypothetical protein DI535_19650 [Citrobacter freundii]|nr:MAG: hypothetical protein DI535_19650 [Citrobacter freundii]